MQEVNEVEINQLIETGVRYFESLVEVVQGPMKVEAPMDP